MDFDQEKIETKLTEEIMLIFSELGRVKLDLKEIIPLEPHYYNMVYSHVHKILTKQFNGVKIIFCGLDHASEADHSVLIKAIVESVSNCAGEVILVDDQPPIPFHAPVKIDPCIVDKIAMTHYCDDKPKSKRRKSWESPYKYHR